jgi:asparagine synthetase B (glutamine-hydrolysing)
VILAAFDRWGIGMPSRFAGMFAVAVWILIPGASLFRDRLGKKPLYVYVEPGLVTFGLS